MKYPQFKVRVDCMTFNHSKYITDAMNGFTMQQTDFPYICTIVDDASTDGEQDVIRKYVEDYFDLSDYNMVKVKRATFVSVLFTTDVISKNGLPYKEYFIWGDDTEYTIRLSKKYPCYVALKSKVVHKRKIQKNIEFENETDKSRLNFYLYKYRNEAFSYISRKERTRLSWILGYSFQGLKFLIKGKFKHSKILFMAAFLLVSFNPRIVYIKS